MAAVNPSYRDWCFTINNPQILGAVDCSAKAQADALWAHAAGKDARYMVLQYERAESGTMHFQGYLVLKKAKRLTGVRNINSQAHWEHRLGTHEQVRSDRLVNALPRSLLCIGS